MLKVVEPPEITEVALDAIKLHLRIDHAEEDDLIKTLMNATREYAETTLCHRAFEVQMLELVIKNPVGDIKLPKPPLLEIVEVCSMTEDGDKYEWLGYEVDDTVEPATLKLNGYPEIISITYKAGFETLPNEYLLWQKMMVAHYYENRQAILPVGHNIMKTPFVADYLLQSYRMFGVI